MYKEALSRTVSQLSCVLFPFRMYLVPLLKHTTMNAIQKKSQKLRTVCIFVTLFAFELIVVVERCTVSSEQWRAVDGYGHNFGHCVDRDPREVTDRL